MAIETVATLDPLARGLLTRASPAQFSRSLTISRLSFLSQALNTVKPSRSTTVFHAGSGFPENKSPVLFP